MSTVRKRDAEGESDEAWKLLWGAHIGCVSQCNPISESLVTWPKMKFGSVPTLALPRLADVESRVTRPEHSPFRSHEPSRRELLRVSVVEHASHRL